MVFLNMLLKSFWFMCVINMISWPKSQTQIRSALSNLKPLIETQEDIIGVLEEIIQRKKKKLCFIKRELERYKQEHNKAINSPKQYLRNSVNNLTLVKRLTVDLDFIEHVIDERSELTRNKSLIFPSKEDYGDAVKGIYVLQMVYRLNVTQLTDGASNASFSLPMTTFDCYEIGRALCDRDLHKHGLPWLLEAYRLIDGGRPSYGLKKITIVWNICIAYNALDDNEKYIEWTEKLIEMKPNVDIKDLQVYMDIHRVRWGKKEWAKTQAHELEREKYKNNPRKLKKYKLKKTLLLNPIEEVNECKNKKLSKGYKTLCRGEFNVGSYIAKRLKCWYSAGHHAFTGLARIKTEQLYVKPDIFLFYDVLHDAEIESFMNFAEPRLTHTIGISRGSSADRFYEHSVIGENYEATKLLTQRIADFSGLNVTSSEPYYVSYFGVWGFHSPHFGYLQDQNITKKSGKRLATTLFYMSEVKQGGATVFPALGLTVHPVKGAALFWTNQHPSGEGDNVTCHGECPVLRGSKWTVTKWINDINQELVKPCTTKFQSRRARDIPHPELKRCL